MQNIVGFKNTKSEKIQWFNLIAVFIFHVLAIWALFEFSWQNLAAAGLMWWLAGSLGIGLGYHRLLTHKGFKTPKALEYFLTVCGTFALQGGAISWVTTHRLHHAFTDTDKDPHSPRGGIFWSHVGWILKGTSQNHEIPVHQKYSPDLMKDSVHLLLNKYYVVPTVIAGVLFWAVGGWTMVLWAIFLRTVWGWHCTWLVNSATHLWGSKRFETGDDSRNNALVALLTFGEGWHNNHHAYPVSARHGIGWYEFDVNWWQIKLLEKLGLVKQIKVYSEEKTDEKRFRHAA